MAKKLNITDWRKLQQGDIILVEGKERIVTNIENGKSGEDDPFVIALNKDQCSDLCVYSTIFGETGWFNTVIHPWIFVRRPKR